MRKKGTFIFISWLLFFCSSCTNSVKPEDLYGEWKYIKVENLRDAAKNTPDWEIEVELPYIKFSENSYLVIMWGGKAISQGTFRLEGNIIRITDTSQGKRYYPFIIRKLTGNELIFETMTPEIIRVTSMKVKNR